MVHMRAVRILPLVGLWVPLEEGPPVVGVVECRRGAPAWELGVRMRVLRLVWLR